MADVKAKSDAIQQENEEIQDKVKIAKINTFGPESAPKLLGLHMVIKSFVKDI